MVSFRSALERKKVRTTCCSLSRRLAGVSGMTFTTRASSTRWNVRPTLASAVRACSKGTSRRSMLIVWSTGTRGRRRSSRPPRAPARGRSRAGWRCGRRGPSGSFAPGPRSRPGRLRSRTRSFRACTEAPGPMPRWWRSASSMSWPSVVESGLRSRASLNSSSASLCRPRERSRRPARACSSDARRRARSRALAVVRVVGVVLERLGVLEHGLVVVPAALGLLAEAEGGRRRAPRQRHGEEDRGGPHPETTSTPFGTWNRNSASSRPTFSLKRSNANWLRLPCASTHGDAADARGRVDVEEHVVDLGVGLARDEPQPADAAARRRPPRSPRTGSGSRPARTSGGPGSRGSPPASGRSPGGRRARRSRRSCRRRRRSSSRARGTPSACGPAASGRATPFSTIARPSMPER